MSTPAPSSTAPSTYDYITHEPSATINMAGTPGRLTTDWVQVYPITHTDFKSIIDSFMFRQPLPQFHVLACQVLLYYFCV